MEGTLPPLGLCTVGPFSSQPSQHLLDSLLSNTLCSHSLPSPESILTQWSYCVENMEKIADAFKCFLPSVRLRYGWPEVHSPRHYKIALWVDEHSQAAQALSQCGIKATLLGEILLYQAQPPRCPQPRLARHFKCRLQGPEKNNWLTFLMKSLDFFENMKLYFAVVHYKTAV